MIKNSLTRKESNKLIVGGELKDEYT